MSKFTLLILVLARMLMSYASATAESWDVAENWQESKNPNGAWSYELPTPLANTPQSVVSTQSGEVVQDSVATSGVSKRFSVHYDAWLSDELETSSNQSAWGMETKGSPGVFRAVKGHQLDIPEGRVCGRSPFLIRWTAPRDCSVMVSGGAWMPRDTGRVLKLSINLKRSGAPVVEPLLNYVIPHNATGFDSTNPLAFSHMAKGTQATNQVQGHLSLQKGDSLEFIVLAMHGGDDFVGLDILIKDAERHDTASLGEQSFGAASLLFDTSAPSRKWSIFKATGFDAQVTGTVFRKSTPATNGMPLGGIDTGCIDLETSGLLGYMTIFNSHVPRRGPLNLPFLGISVSGRVWVLCDPQQTKPGEGNFQPPFCYNFPAHVEYLTKQGLPISEAYQQELTLHGVETVKDIHYWGHYPVADIEYETSAPVKVALRAWSSFLPGQLKESCAPGAVFEVHLVNSSEKAQSGSLAVSFPGPTKREAGSSQFLRSAAPDGMSGVAVSSDKASYILATAVDDKTTVRAGGELGADGTKWSKIERELPVSNVSESGSSLAVDFTLAPGETRIVPVLLAWHAEEWNAGGKNWANSPRTFKHMYATYYKDVAEAADFLMQRRKDLLTRILKWQQVIYADDSLPGWLGDSLINSLHLITETGMWAQADHEHLSWVDSNTGLFGMNECPRTCPQIECIPCGFYGNLPLVYFFPELARSSLNGYRKYATEDGAAPWVWGGWTAGEPPIDFTSPIKGYQWTTNGISLVSMIDRYLLCHGEHDSDFLKEFYPLVKRNTIYTVGLRTTPDYSLGQRILMMPDGDHGQEWFEAGNPAWFGMTTHAGALHLAQIRIALRMAEQANDQEFAAQCREWLKLGSDALESDLWNGSYYLNCCDPLTGKTDDLVFAFQLDGEWTARFHGLPSVFRSERVSRTLMTIKDSNARISRYGIVNYATADGSPAPVGGYGPYSYFPPEVLMLSMNYIYDGQEEYGVELARRCWDNITCRQGYAWDAPNIMRGDQDTGERGILNGGHDYYQNMMIWSMPAALAKGNLSTPLEPNGIALRVLDAAAPLGVNITESK